EVRAGRRIDVVQNRDREHHGEIRSVIGDVRQWRKNRRFPRIQHGPLRSGNDRTSGSTLPGFVWKDCDESVGAHIFLSVVERSREKTIAQGMERERSSRLGSRSLPTAIRETGSANASRQSVGVRRGRNEL